MAIKDILLPLVGEPNAAAIAAIDKCVALAGDIGARVTALAVEEDLLVRPKVVISSDLENALAAAAVRSVSDARGLLKAFDAAANRFAVPNEQRLARLGLADIPGNFVEPARLADLSIVPVKPDDGGSEKIAERLIFETGRPILICPEERAAELSVVFDRVMIAWDHTAQGRARGRRCVAITSGRCRRAGHHGHRRQVAGRDGIRGRSCAPSLGARDQCEV
jgi:hypothetical protein